MKKLIFITMLLMATAIPFNAQAYYGTPYVAPSGQTIYYVITNDNAKIVAPYDYNGTLCGTDMIWACWTRPTGDLVIPDTIIVGSNKYAVIEIGENAFDGCSGLTTVSIPQTVTSIGQLAFAGTGLDTIWVPSTVTSIGYGAFGSQGMSGGNEAVSILVYFGTATAPNSRWGALSWIDGYEENGLIYTSSTKDTLKHALYPHPTVNLPPSVRHIMDQAFAYDSVLQNIAFGDSLISIGEYAFYQCKNLQNVTFPESLTNIGTHAFSSCSSIDTIVIPRHLTSSINPYIFLYNNLSCIIVDSNNTVYDSRDECNAIIMTSTNELVLGCKNTIIPSTVSKIGDHAFYECMNMPLYFEIPASVDSIGRYAFANTDIREVWIKKLLFPSFTSYYNYSFPNGTLIYMDCSLYSSEGTITIPSAWGNYEIAPHIAYPHIVNVSSSPKEGTVKRKYHCSDSSLVITATPAYGYHFDHWSNGSTSNPDTIYITSDTTITAIFAKDQFSVSGKALTDGVMYVGPRIEHSDNETTRWDLMTTTDGDEWWSIVASYYYDRYYVPNYMDTNLFYWHISQYNKAQTTHAWLYYDIVIPQYGRYDYQLQYYFPGNTGDNDDCLNIGIVKADALLTDSWPSSVVRNISSNRRSSSTESSGTVVNDYIDLSAGHYRLVFYWRNDADAIGYGNAPQVYLNYFRKNGCDVRFGNNITSAADNTMIFVVGDTTANYRDTIAISAVSADTHFVFSHWADGDTSNPRTVVVNDSRTYYAIFDAAPCSITLSKNIESAGVVSGAGSYPYMSSNVISATPNHGYIFSHWSDGITDATRDILLMSDTALMAYFVVDTFDVVINVKTIINKNDVTFGSWSWTGAGTAETKWFTCDSMIYISSDYGANNTYDNTTACTEWYYQGVEMTAGTYYYSFDWRAYGESCCDYLSVGFSRPGQILTTSWPNDAVIIASKLNMSNDWTTKSGTITIPTTGTYVFAFSWRNDGSLGSDYPAAVRNIQLYRYDTLINVGGTTSGAGRFAYMSIDSLIAIPDVGYHFVKWQRTNISIQPSYTGNPHVATITGDFILDAIFELNSYHLMATPNYVERGNVEGDTGTFYYNSTHEFNAISNHGYHFSHWNDGNTENPRTVTLTQDTSFTAIFEPNSYFISTSSNDSSMGTVIGGGLYDYNTTQTLEAEPAEGHHFIRWTDGNTDNPRNILIEGDTSYTAVFAIDTLTVNVSSNNMVYGTVNGGGTFVYGSPCTIEAEAYSGYVFVRWSNGVTYNPYTFAVLTNMDIEAVFAPEGSIHNVSVQVQPAGTGTVTGDGPYATGETITLEALPNDGWHFVRWQDNNTDNPRNIVVYADMAFTAFFESDDTQGIGSIEDGGIRIWSNLGNIVIEGCKDMIVSVYDMIGRRVASTKVEADIIRIAVPSGVYLIKADLMPARKVVVVR